MTSFSLFSPPYYDIQLYNNIGGSGIINLHDAITSCSNNSSCGGITETSDHNFSLRNGTVYANPVTMTPTIPSDMGQSGSISWVKQTYPVDPKNWIRDSTVVFACIFEFYNSIYDDGPYKNLANINSNTFKLNFNYFLFPINQFSSTIVNTVTIAIGSYLTLPSSDFQQLKNSLISVMNLPVITSVGNVYSIRLNLNRTQFNAYKAKTTIASKNAYIIKLLSGLLQDTAGKIMKSGSLLQNGTDPVLINSTISGISVIDLSTYDIYDIKESEFSDGSYPSGFFCVGKITATIQTWSPMLACYLSKFFSGTINEVTHQKIMQDTGVVLTSYYQTANQDLVKSLIVNNCGTFYTPPVNVSTAFGTTNLLLNSSSSSCLCYNSSLTPAGQKTGNDIVAMCFDKNCTDTEVKVFGLNNTVCNAKCSNISTRLMESGSDKARNSANLDDQKLYNLCGLVYNPYVDSSVNFSVMMNGIYFTICMCLIVYAVCASYEVRGFFTTIWIIIVMIIFGLITFVLTFYLAGRSSCDEKFNPECLTRVDIGSDATSPWIKLVKKVDPNVKGSVQIPYPFSSDFNDKNPWQKSVDLSFCDPTKMVNCECIVDSDCKNGCTCHSGTCTFKNVPRQTETTSKSYPNKTLIIMNCVISIIMICVLIYMHEKLKWSIDTIIFSGIIILLGVVMMGINMYYNYRKISVTNIIGTCNSAKF